MESSAGQPYSEEHPDLDVVSTVQHVSENIAALTDTLDDYSELLLEYPLQRFQESLKGFADMLGTLSNRLEHVQQQASPPDLQPSLFAFDAAASSQTALQKELDAKQEQCDAQHAEMQRLQEKLTVSEEAYRTLKMHADILQKRLDNILGSFDATLGS